MATLEGIKRVIWRIFKSFIESRENGRKFENVFG
jgi:hypothetical protein